MSKHKSHHGAAVAEAKEADKATKRKQTFDVPKLVPGTETVLQWYQIHGFADRNIRADSFGDPIADLYEQVRPLGTTKDADGEREETDEDRRMGPKDVVGRLLPGWSQRDKHNVHVTIATPDEQKLAIAERTANLAAWRERAKRENEAIFGQMAEFASAYWFPGGEPRPPVAIIHECHRRTYSFPAVVFARRERGIGEVGDYTIPVMVTNPMSKLAELDARLSENLSHDLGRSPLTPLDFLRIAKMALDAGGTESIVRKYGKVGEAQTAFRFCTLAARYPHLKLYERAMLPKPAKTAGYKYDPSAYLEGETTPEATAAAWIPYSTGMKEELQALLTDKDVTASGPLKDRPEVVTDTDVVASYLANVASGGTRPKNGWTQVDSKNLTLADRHSPVFVFLGELLYKGDVKGIDAFDKAFGRGFSLIVARTLGKGIVQRKNKDSGDMEDVLTLLAEDIRKSMQPK